MQGNGYLPAWGSGRTSTCGNTRKRPADEVRRSGLMDYGGSLDSTGANHAHSGPSLGPFDDSAAVPSNGARKRRRASFRPCVPARRAPRRANQASVLRKVGIRDSDPRRRHFVGMSVQESAVRGAVSSGDGVAVEPIIESPTAIHIPIEERCSYRWRDASPKWACRRTRRSVA